MNLKEALYNYAVLLELPDPKSFEERALAVVKAMAEPDTSPPLWRTDLFTDAERGTMMELTMDEISDCIKEVAQTQLDNETSIVELLGYLDKEVEQVAEYLTDSQEGKFDLNLLAEGRPEDKAYWTYMLRFGLIDEDGVVTERGQEYISVYQ